MRNLLMSTAMVVVGLAGGLIQPAAAADDHKIVDEALTLDIHFHFRDKYVYDNDWPVEKRAAELTGIKLNGIASLATTESDDAFNLMIASGDIPDIIGGNGLRDEFNQYGMEGAFQPMKDLINEHAPNMRAFFDKFPELEQAITAPDGDIYHIPYLPDGKYGRAYFIRHDWLDKLGLQPPETVDELYEVLVAFRDGDPNGNGQKDEVPLFMRHWEELIRLVTLWDGRMTGSDTYHDFHVADGKVAHGYDKESYKTGIANLAKWYKEGLIDPEIFTRGSRAREHLLSNDLGGVTHDWFASTAGYNTSLADKVEGFSLKAFAPPASVSGRRLQEHRRIPVRPDGWAIGHTNEHPVETIKYFDFWFSDIGRRLSNFGVEGVHYDMVDGTPTYKPEILEADAPVNAQMWEIGAQIPRGFYQDYGYEIQWTNEVALEGIALYDQGDYLIDSFLGVSLNTDEKKVFDKYWSSLETYFEEMQQAWILGSRDVEEDWDSFLAQLEQLGYYEVLSVMQSAYERQYSES